MGWVLVNSWASSESFLVDPNGEIALVRRGALDAAYFDRNVTPLIKAATDEGKAMAS